jgi:hypothetical protein
MRFAAPVLSSPALGFQGLMDTVPLTKKQSSELAPALPWSLRYGIDPMAIGVGGTGMKLKVSVSVHAGLFIVHSLNASEIFNWNGTSTHRWRKFYISVTCKMNPMQFIKHYLLVLDIYYILQKIALNILNIFQEFLFFDCLCRHCFFSKQTPYYVTLVSVPFHTYAHPPRDDLKLENMALM